MGQINFDIVAIVINLLNIYIFFSRSRLFIAQTRIFGLLLFVSLGSAIMDVVGVVTYWNAQDYSLGFLYGINVVYYLFQNTVPPVFTLFAISLGGRLTRMKRVRRILLFAPWLLALSVIVLTPVTGWAFSFDGDLRYSRGPAVFLFYAIVIFYSALILANQLLERRRLPRDARMAVVLLLPFSLLPVAIQFFFPSLLLQSTGIALAELIILLTIQDFGRFIDHSSGLFNRDGLVAQLDLIMLKRKPFTVFIVILDSVDFLRDALGPAVFGALEREMARQLFGLPRADCFAAQLGVAKFVRVIVGRESAETEAHELIRRLERPWAIRGRVLSIGAFVCRIRFPEDTKDIQRIFQAQYHLSRSRKGYPVNALLSLADLSLADTGRQLAVSQAILRALVSQGFDIHFQPIVSAATGKVVSAEALVRLHDDQLGWISPAEFIPLAERNGSIHQIGDFVLERSCAFLAELRSAGLSLEYLELNLSALECIQSNLCARLLAASRRYGLSPSDLCFEITETAANLSPALMKKNVESLVAAGFSIAIDDFGTGYSNIGSLMEIPFRIVKLDRSIIVGMERSQSGLVALEGLVSMFRLFDAELVAEGVETAAQLGVMKGLSVDLIQGFFYSRPIPREEFMRFLQLREAPCT